MKEAKLFHPPTSNNLKQFNYEEKKVGLQTIVWRKPIPFPAIFLSNFHVRKYAIRTTEQNYFRKLKTNHIIERPRTSDQRHGCKILYNHEQVKSQRQFDLKMQEKPLEEVIKKCLENTNLVYKIVDDVFVITPKSTTSKEDEKKAKEITGVVVDVKGDSIPGVTVTIKGTTIGTSTDANGLFKMTIPPT